MSVKKVKKLVNLLYHRGVNKSLIDDRIIFPNYFSQGKFLSMVKQKRQITLKKFAEELGISVRTLTDWMNGSYRMVYSVAIYLSKSSNINLPRGIKKIRWKDHVSMAGKIGASINLNKNGSIGGSKEFRIKRWREWESKGRFKKQSIYFQGRLNFQDIVLIWLSLLVLCLEMEG